MKIVSKSLKETEQIAVDFLRALSQKIDGATVVGLHGNLGSGKTTFTQAVARLLGVTESVTSPTFVIMKRFDLPERPLHFGQTGIKPAQTYQSPLGAGGDLGFKFENLIHIDSYRLKSGEELKKLGWDEIVAEPKNLILIEWPENVSEVIPKDVIKIDFEFVDEGTRKIRLL